MGHTSSTPSRRFRRWRTLLGPLLIVLLTSSIVSGAFLLNRGKVAHADIVDARGVNGGGTPPLLPYNHDIQQHPMVYLDFWGTKWDTDTHGVIPQVKATFKALAGTAYNNILGQYTNGSGGYVHNDVRLMDTWVDGSYVPPHLTITDQVGDEEKAAVKHFGLASGDFAAMHNVQVIVFPQQGSNYALGIVYCAQHYYDSTSGAAYGLVKTGDTSCDPTGDVAQDTAWEAVHEYAETATDRQLKVDPVTFLTSSQGWHTGDHLTPANPTPHEVADLCQGWTVANSYALLDLYSAPTNTYFTLPYLWSNQANGGAGGCVLSRSWPAANACPPALGLNSNGTWVRVLQRALNAYEARLNFSTTTPASWTFPLTIDGDYGPQTDAAVLDFQNSPWGDGLPGGGGGVGDRTWSLLGFCESYPPVGLPVLADDTGNAGLTNCPDPLAQGDSGVWVEALQMRLNQAFYYGMYPDTPNDFEVSQTVLWIDPNPQNAYFDVLTTNAVVDFQSRAKFGSFTGGGGAVGNRTWSNLGMCW